MKKEKFLDLLKGREELEREILLAFSSEVQDHVTGSHMDGHVTGHELINLRDMCDGQHQPGDPGPPHGTITWQQQSGNPEHVIDIEAIIADWLGEGMAQEGSTEAQGSAV